MSGTLKLRAHDAEDIQILSAVLQDSIVPVCDMVFQREDKNFVIVAQRLRRESNDKPDRICSALTIKGVTSVQTSGFDQKKPDLMLDLLALMLEGHSLTLIFAGQARIKLTLASWAAALEDFGESWPALCSPCHDENGTKTA